MKTSDLTGAALDWAVARCEKAGIVLNYEQAYSFKEQRGLGEYNYSTDWSQGGPIIERELGRVEHVRDGYWEASVNTRGFIWEHGYGPTPLIAAMRCYVAIKLGDEVEVPDGL